MNNFPYGINGKLIIFRVPILKHIMVFDCVLFLYINILCFNGC